MWVCFSRIGTMPDGHTGWFIIGCGDAGPHSEPVLTLSSVEGEWMVGPYVIVGSVR
jgi:hypothetical protein